MKARVFLTGVTGLLGSHLARELINQGYGVKALIRTNSDKKLITDFENKLDIVFGELEDVPFIKDIFKNIEIIIHSAAIVSFDPRHKEQMFQVNVKGTKIVAEEARNAGVQKLIHISSVAALGRKPTVKMIDESAKWDSTIKTSYYGVTKYLAELEVARCHAEGLDTVVLCPSIILGPGEKGKSSSKLLDYIYHAKPFYTDGIVNVVDVRDVCAAILKLCENRAIAGRYIISGHSLTYKTLFESLAKQFETKPPYIKLPSFLIAIFWRLEWIRSRISKNSPLITKETSISAKSKFTYNNRKSVEILGVKYRPIEDTVKFCKQMFVDN